MSMTGRIALLMAAVLLLALGGSLAVHGVVAQHALQAQQALRNREAAAGLALALSLAGRGESTLRFLAQTQFDHGTYDSLRLQALDGRLLLDIQPAQPRAAQAPAWLQAALPIAAAPGRAAVRDASGEWAELRVAANVAWAYDALWDACQRTAVLLAMMAAMAALLTAWAVQAWRRPLQAVLMQAQALEQGRFVEAEEPRLPELRPLARSMNNTVRRLREVFSAQAEQVALLQRQAQLDLLTALPLRRQFIGQLQHRLAEPGGPGVALLLLRVLQLGAMNPRLGHEATDRVLVSIADVLLTYLDRVPGAFAGRLNGSDFALCLPVPGVAEETGESLRLALAAAPPLRSSGVQVAIGGSDGLRNLGASAALAAADAALAQAEAAAENGPGFTASAGAGLAKGSVAVHTLAVVQQVGSAAVLAGARAWREQIAEALVQGRVRLAEVSVVDAQGQELHLECRLRVQLTIDGEFQGAGRWLALARRSRLLQQVDLASLDLALRAIAMDGRSRAVHMSSSSLKAQGFVADVAQRLRASPAAARRLNIECLEGLRPSARLPLAGAAGAWRPWGVRLGVQHAGATPQQLPALQAAGVSYVKISAQHLRGVATDAAVRSYAQSLVALIHGLGLTALADGMDDAADVTALWALGFDGVSGTAVAGAA